MGEFHHNGNCQNICQRDLKFSKTYFSIKCMKSLERLLYINRDKTEKISRLPFIEMNCMLNKKLLFFFIISLNRPFYHVYQMYFTIPIMTVKFVSLRLLFYRFIYVHSYSKKWRKNTYIHKHDWTYITREEVHKRKKPKRLGNVHYLQVRKEERQTILLRPNTTPTPTPVRRDAQDD